MGIAGLFEQTQPPATANSWTEYQSEWLANIVLAKAPEHPIWERAVEKAIRRAGELKVEDKRTPSQVYLDRQKHEVEMKACPSPRRYFPGGAFSMPRQGSKPVS
jgi:hypothetical protein